MSQSEEYFVPSLFIAFSHCFAHGYDLRVGLRQQQLETASGYWTLIRYNPAFRAAGKKPFVLDSPRPTIPLRDYAYNENRYKVLTKSNPEEAERLMVMAQETVDRRWETYEHLAKQEPAQFERAG